MKEYAEQLDIFAKIKKGAREQFVTRREARLEETNRAYVSFGAGVQSTAIAFLVMEQHPELVEVCGGRLPEMFMFADTGDEPVSVYEHAERMTPLFDAHDITFEIVHKRYVDVDTPGGFKPLAEHVADRISAGRGGVNNPPFWTFADTRGIPTPTWRRCTVAYKARELDKRARHYFDVYAGQLPEGEDKVCHWYGISWDEVDRMRDSDEEWKVNFYPLVEMRWTRDDCIEYLSDKTYLDGTPVLVVKSACVYCPYRSASKWQDVRDEPEDWDKAIELDRAIGETWTKFNEAFDAIADEARELCFREEWDRLRSLMWGAWPGNAKGFEKMDRYLGDARDMDSEEAFELLSNRWRRVAGYEQRPYLTKHLKPLEEVDIDQWVEDEGEGEDFGECGGLCGV